jgi:hypothetical protein
MIPTTLLVALAVGSPAAPEGVSLRIDDSALLAHERPAVVEHTTLFVREDATKALGQSPDVTLVDDPQAAAILVTLSWVSYEDSIYGVAVHTQRPGEAARLVEQFECECINSGLAKAIVERLPAALGQLEPPTTGPGPAVTGPATGPVDEPAVRKPLGTMGKAGIGLLAAGVAGTITGGIVFAQQRRYDEDDPEREVWSGRDFEPPGVALMVTGGVIAATGLVLLVVDRVQARNDEKSGRGTARLTPSHRGMTLTLRF